MDDRLYEALFTNSGKANTTIKYNITYRGGLWRRSPTPVPGSTFSKFVDATNDVATVPNRQMQRSMR